MSMPEPSYWFQIRGAAPLGPMTKAEFFNQHGFEPAGEIRWCSVGQSDWRPLSELVHKLQQNPAPPCDESPPTASESTPPSAASVPSPTVPAAAAPFPEWLGVLIGVVLFSLMCYALYESMRSLTPREVVERFDRCRTVEEAKKYATPNFHPVLLTLWMIAGGEQDDVPLEIIEEGAGTASEQYIGIRLANFDRTVGRNVSSTGFITLRKTSEGWKIDDVTLVTMDGQAFPEPVSLARNHPALLQQLPQHKPALTSSTTSSRSGNEVAKKGAGGLLARLLMSGYAKPVGLAVLGTVAGAYALVRKARRKL